MSAELQQVRGRTLPNPGQRGTYVPGYVPVTIDRDVKERLVHFRQTNLPVDLRIERAMISAATDLCLDSPDLQSRLQGEAEAACRQCDSGADQHRAGEAPVLIQRSVKTRLRMAAATWGLEGADNRINEAMVSAAVSIVLAAEHLHEAWVRMTAVVVGWEVEEGFKSSRR